MDIKRVIHNFSIRNEQGYRSENLTVPCEVQFPPRSPKQQILFLYQSKEIYFDLIRVYSPNELQEFKLIESKLINKDYLNKLSTIFSFNVIAHPLANNLTIGVIPNISQDYGYTCYGAIKRVDDQYFFIIYSKKGSTNFEDDTIYVYGIWEVSLPKKIKYELFDSTNTSV